MKRKIKFLLILTLLFSFILRFYKFDQTLRFDADEAMAYLIAERIIEDKFLLLVGPFTSLGQSVNVVPPTYYYLITFLYWLFRSAIAVTFVFLLIEIAAVYFIFRFGQLLTGARTGMLSALYFAVSSSMISYSRDIWMPYRLPFFIAVSFYLIFLSSLKKSGRLLLLSLIFYVISLMYISSLLLFLPFIVLYLQAYKKINHKEKIYKGLLQIIFALFLFYLPVFLFEIRNNYPFLDFIRNISTSNQNLITFGFENYISSLTANIKLFIRSIIAADFNFLPLIFLFLTLFIYSCSNKEIKFKKEILIILTVFSSGFLLSGFYGGKILIYHLAPLYPFFFILSAYITSVINTALLKKFSIANFTVFTIILFFILKYFIGNFLAENSRFNNLSGYHNRNQGFYMEAQYILQSSENKGFNIFTVTPDDKTGYHTTSYYYVLNKFSEINRIPFNNAGNWLNPFPAEKKELLFLICKNYNATEKLQDDQCLDETENIIEVKRGNVVEKKYMIYDIVYKIKTN